MWWKKVQLARARHRPSRPRSTGTDIDGGENITVISAVVNVFLALVKLAAGILGRSAALVADAGHSLSDLVSDGVTLWAVRIAQLPPDVDHPYGHGRFEAVGALGVSILVMAAGIGIAGEGWLLLRDLACSGCYAETPGALALAVCMVSIVSKELLFRATDIVGRRLNSPVIRANAAHHRSDVWSSVVALVGVVGARLGVPALDPIAAIGVAIMVFNMGLGISVDALGQLTDTTDEQLVSMVKKAALQVVGTANVMSTRARAMGSSWLAEVEVRPDHFVTSATAADHLAARVRHAVLDSVPTIDECMVNVRSELNVTRSRILASLATPQELDGRVREVLAKLPEVEVTRTMAHFANLEPSVDVWVKMPSMHSVDECLCTAQRARMLLLENVRDLSSSEFHLVL